MDSGQSHKEGKQQIRLTRGDEESGKKRASRVPIEGEHRRGDREDDREMYFRRRCKRMRSTEEEAMKRRN